MEQMEVLKESVHECGECTHVANRDCIVVPIDAAKKAQKNNHDPVFINFFTMPRWVGHAAFYVFKCSYCDCLSVDYPHGYTGPGFIFLTCQNCNVNLVLDSSRYAEIYKRDGTEPPPTLLAAISMLVKRKLMRTKLAWQRVKIKTPNSHLP